MVRRRLGMLCRVAGAWGTKEKAIDGSFFVVLHLIEVMQESCF
jgi:hypothetical protein